MDSYPREEMDLILKAVDTKIETNHNEVMAELKQHRTVHDKMLEQLKFTNGKVKKIIMALIAIGAFALGTGLENVGTLIKLLV